MAFHEGIDDLENRYNVAAEPPKPEDGSEEDLGSNKAEVYEGTVENFPDETQKNGFDYSYSLDPAENVYKPEVDEKNKSEEKDENVPKTEGGETLKPVEDGSAENLEKKSNKPEIPEVDKEQKFNDYLKGMRGEKREEWKRVGQDFEDHVINKNKDSIYEKIKDASKLPFPEILEFCGSHELTEREKKYLYATVNIKKYLENENNKTEGEEDEKNKPPYDDRTRVNCNNKIPYSEEKKPVMEDLFLAEGYLKKISAKLSHGEELSETIRQQGKEILIKNGFSQETVEGMPDQKIKEALEEKINEAEIQNLSKEAGEKYQKMQEALGMQKNNIEQEAEKIGCFDRLRKIGNFYRKVPFKYKFLVGFGLGLGVGALSGVAATGCALALLCQRALGGAGTFVMVEGLLQKLTERNGRERGKKEKQIQTIIALVSGVAVGGKGVNFLNNYFNPDAFTTPDIGPDIQNVTEVAHNNLSSNSGETFGTLPTEITPQPDLSFTIGGETGTVWDGIEKTLQNQGSFEGLNESQQTIFTDSIKDRIALMSPEELHQIGISSDNINLVHPGETIDLSHVLGETPPVDKIVEQVSTLPDSVSDHIGVPEHPDTFSGDNLNEAITNNFSPEAASHMNSDLNSLYSNWESPTEIKSVDWTDPKNGLRYVKIETLDTPNINGIPNGVGIESSDAVTKTQRFIMRLINEAHTEPNSNETVGAFFERAYGIIENAKDGK